MRILVIDDDPDVQHTLAEMLRSGGHDVVLARVGGALITDIREAAFDLVVTDMEMPHITGWHVREWVAAHRPEVPVILVSGRIPANDPRITAFAAYIAKPVRKAALLAAVEEARGSGAGA